MISVAIIGYGNVAQHLHKAFTKANDIVVKQIYSRTLSKVKHIKKIAITNNLNALIKVDIYIIAVSDNAISFVSSQIKNDDSLTVHTSGSVSINELKNKGSKGVFYPLQSFSKDKKVNFNNVPFLLETEKASDYKTLDQLASSIGKKIYPINSKQRQQLHVAAVFVNNFTNHMYKIGQDICNQHEIPFDILQPLIKETALKTESLSPKEAQTGPAIRNDENTIEAHLKILNKEQQTIYKTLTKSIQNG